MAQTKLRSFRAWTALATVILLACATVLVPLAHSQQPSDHAKVLGMKLMCTCGCAQVLVQCNHLNCPSSAPMLKELDAHISSAEADDLIIQDFIQEYGIQVLSSPPNKGFNRVAWLMPGFAFAVGLCIVAYVIGRWRQNDLAASPVQQPVHPGISAEAMARAREKVNRETEE